MHYKSTNLKCTNLNQLAQHMKKEMLSGRGYIDDDIHTWENNVIGEGVGRTPPRVELIGTRGISTTTYPIKNKKTKKK